MSNHVYLGPVEPRFPGSSDTVRMVYVTHEDKPRTRFIEANVWNWVSSVGLIIGGSPHRIPKAFLRTLPNKAHDGHYSARQVAGELVESEEALSSSGSP